MYGGYPQKNRIQQKSKQRKTARFFLYVHISFWLLLSTSFFFIVVWAPLFAVRTVIVEGNQVVAEDSIRNSVEKTMAGNLFFVIPEGHALTIARGEIEKNLISAYPRIQHATINLSGLHTVSVVVSERDPRYTYCDRDGACTLLDSNGYAFESAMNGRSTPITISGERGMFLDMENRHVASDTPVTIPSQIVSEALFGKINRVVDGFRDLGFIVSEIVFQKAGYIDFYTSYNALGHIRLSIHIDDSLDVILNNLATARQNSNLGHILDTDPSTIDYIILYTGNKVIFKQKTES